VCLCVRTVVYLKENILVYDVLVLVLLNDPRESGSESIHCLTCMKCACDIVIFVYIY